MAWPGMAGQGKARRGAAWHGAARRGMARQGKGFGIMGDRHAVEPITVTIRQFGEISNLSKDSIYKLINSGEIRSVVICGRRLIDLASYRSLVARTSPRKSPTRGGLGGGK